MYNISVIIPFYNCEDVIEKCLESVLDQTLKEIEIICIDDGSTDESMRILSEYESKFSNLKVISQVNSGSGIARNNGIKISSGKYLAFLDADDHFVDKTALEEMYNICEKNELSICGSLRMNFHNKKIYDSGMFSDIFDDNTSFKILDYNDYQMDYNYQSFIFSRKMIVVNMILFPDYRRYQDPPFFVKAMNKAGRFGVINKYLYGYNISDDFVKYNSQKVYDLLKGLKDNIEFAFFEKLDKIFEVSVDRLEYEFCDLIVYYSNQAIIDLLCEIDKFISDNTITDKMIRPLEKIQSTMNFNCSYDMFIDELNSSESIYIYGAGNYGIKFLNYLKKLNFEYKIKGFLVSSVNDIEPKSVMGLPVIEISDFSEDSISDIYIAVSGVTQKTIFNILNCRKMKNIKFIDTYLISQY